MRKTVIPAPYFVRDVDDKKGAKLCGLMKISLKTNTYVVRPQGHPTTIHLQNPRAGLYISFAPEIYERRSPFQAYQEQILRFEASQACLWGAVRAQAHNWRYDRLGTETRPPTAESNGPALEELSLERPIEMKRLGFCPRGGSGVSGRRSEYE